MRLKCIGNEFLVRSKNVWEMRIKRVGDEFQQAHNEK